jgi:hypothetical protein
VSRTFFIVSGTTCDVAIPKGNAKFQRCKPDARAAKTITKTFTKTITKVQKTAKILRQACVDVRWKSLSTDARGALVQTGDTLDVSIRKLRSKNM